MNGKILRIAETDLLSQADSKTMFCLLDLAGRFG
jgi:hypothetical protein